jgi:hypothetical protein
MRALKAYIEQQNKWNAVFKGCQYEVTTAEGRRQLASHIDAALSPENLTCDGELPRSEVQRRYKQLTQVASELKALDPSVEFYEY